MENKNLKFVEIKVFIHLDGTSYEIVENVKRLIQANTIDVKKIKLVTIDYDVKANNIEKGPVRIYCSDGIAIYLNLTAGYPGTGPHDLCEVLKLCNIAFNENDILSKQDEVKLRYIKDEADVYQFANPDGTYEYSM